MSERKHHQDAVDPGAKTDDEIARSPYYSSHDLREMFSRENAERRRQGAKTLRKLLTAKQDKQVLNKMVRIRDEFEVANNDDIILIWVRQQVEAGDTEDIDPRLIEAAHNVRIPKRTTPVDKTAEEPRTA